MATNMRNQNLRNFTPSQSMGQDARKNTFTSGQAKDSLSGKNTLKEYRPKAAPHGTLGAKDTAS